MNSLRALGRSGRKTDLQENDRYRTGRREFVKGILLSTFGALTYHPGKLNPENSRKESSNFIVSTIYRSLNGTPGGNIEKIIELVGGIEKIIGPEDIVLIKPNAQWWNQGAPNLLALKTFVKLIMERKGGFFGEVILAENCHRGPAPWNSLQSGWAGQFQLNSDVHGINNMNDLSNHLKRMMIY